MIGALTVCKKADAIVSGRTIAVASRDVLIISAQIEEGADPEKISMTLGKIGASVPIIAFNVEQKSPPPRQVIGLPFLSLRKQSPSGPCSQTKTIVLKHRISRLAIGSVFFIVSAGVLVSTLILIVTLQIDRRTDSLRTAETQGESMAGIAIVARRVKQ